MPQARKSLLPPSEHAGVPTWTLQSPRTAPCLPTPSQLPLLLALRWCCPLCHHPGLPQDLVPCLTLSASDPSPSMLLATLPSGCPLLGSVSLSRSLGAHCGVWTFVLWDGLYVNMCRRSRCCPGLLSTPELGGPLPTPPSPPQGPGSGGLGPARGSSC